MTTTALPLHGIRVLDMSWVGAGPYVTRPLSTLGADVIKVESTARMDPIRMMRPAPGGEIGVNRSGYYANRNPGKRSITINLKTAGGLDVARRLVKVSDVVVNNFRAGVMERLGLGWDVVHELNPRTVYVEMPMQGTDGPHRSYVGYGLTLAALSGLYWLSGEPGEIPSGTGTNFPDHVPNPLHTTGAVLCALRQRADTGRGSRIELSQLESTIRMVGPAVVAASADVPVGPMGNRAWGWVPHGVYRCRGAHGFIALAVRSDVEWHAFCDAIDRPVWAEATSPFASQAQRFRQRAELEPLISQVIAGCSGDELARRLTRTGVPAAVVEDAKTLVDENTQLRARDHFTRLAHAEMGETIYDSLPYWFDGQPAKPQRAAPLLGEHTVEVCRDVLDMTNEELASLRGEGALV